MNLPIGKRCDLYGLAEANVGEAQCRASVISGKPSTVEARYDCRATKKIVNQISIL